MSVNGAWFGEAWQEQLREDAGSSQGAFLAFANTAFRALTADELRRYSPEGLRACLQGFWRFADQNNAMLACHVFNPSFEEAGWEAEGTVIEIVARELPFLMNTLRIALGHAGYTIQVLLELSLPLVRDDAGHIVSLDEPRASHDIPYQALLHLELNQHYSNEALVILQTQVLGALERLQQVVEDFPRLLAWCEEAADGLDGKGDAAACPQEAAHFLRWLQQGHFTFLAALREERGQTEALGLADYPGFNPDLIEEESPDHDAEFPLFFAKSRTLSPIQHDRYGDVIVVGYPLPDGGWGELRLYGLYTSRVQQHDPVTMPVLRQKLASLEHEAGLHRLSSEGRALDRLLRQHPRDELLLSSRQELLNGLLPLVQQKDPKRLRFMWKFDRYARFVSVFIYVPKAVFSGDFAERTAGFLQGKFSAQAVHTTTFVIDERFVRLHVLLRLGTTPLAELPVTDELEESLRRLAKTWDDELLDSLLRHYPAAVANQIFTRYQASLPDSYKENTRPLEVLADIRLLEQLNVNFPLAAEVLAEEGREARIKIYHWRTQLDLSSIMPLLESFQLRVVDEQSYCLAQRDECLWLHDFQVELPVSLLSTREERLPLLREALLACWEEKCDVDCFNSLVPSIGLAWREAMIFRAYSAYLKQVGFQLSAESQAQTLARYPSLCRSLLELFRTRFDPALDAADRNQQLAAIGKRLQDQLERVERLEDDRILQQFATLIRATQRCNFFSRPQVEDARFSIKLASRELKDIPLPKPLFEIFVFAPATQGVHLRFGPIARGGIRWSDRVEEFRTEILGLVKAQQVKNSLIVPVGAKGGFILRKAPRGGESLAQTGIKAYQTFLRGLLDLTDNRVGAGIEPPHNVVCHDAPDPYLVVAADKGTARFSDTANAVAAEYLFWLGDAFASGGGQGYDHKEMGITARGAFISLQRLARTAGFDPDSTPFTVVGIGDMAGDVFGNGMLLSQNIKLIAAFNHAHIFLDPTPDPAQSFAERKRLFELPGSTWADYDGRLISQGGGVFSRHERRIRLTAEIRKLLACESEALSPDDVIRALLRAPVDVLWNGGIGTYVKSHQERHADVGDKSNDTVRVDGAELGATLVAEGGNLGMTQRGRIEYSLRGGLCHADFIDNSAGVDCSDHEVNIKIFLQQQIAAGTLVRTERDALLAHWKSEVAALVLADNACQTQTLAVAVHEAGARHREYGELCGWLEQVAGLDRELEALPAAAAWAERAREHKALTRPELAVLLAYTRNHLKEVLAAAPLEKEAELMQCLYSAFPPSMVAQYGDTLQRHPLATSLAAMRLASLMTEAMGMTALPRLLRQRGASLLAIARAFALGREVLNWESLHRQLAQGSQALPEAGVLPVWISLQRYTRRTAGWMLRHGNTPGEVLLNRYRPLQAVLPKVGQYLNPHRREYWDRGAAELQALGLPEGLARQLSALDQVLPLLEVMCLADRASATFADAAALYFGLETLLDLTEVQRCLQDLPVGNGWEAEARDQYRLGLLERLALLAARALSARQRYAGDRELEAWLREWLEGLTFAWDSWQALRRRLRQTELATYAPYVVILAELDQLIRAQDGGGLPPR